MSTALGSTMNSASLNLGLMDSPSSSESTLRETLEKARELAYLAESHPVGPGVVRRARRIHDSLTEALTQLSALERDREAMEKLRADVKDGFCPILVFDDNGKWAVGSDGVQGVEWPLTQTTVFLDDVKWYDDPADAILGTQEQNDG